MINSGLLCVGGMYVVAEVAPKYNQDEGASKNPRRRNTNHKELKSSRLSRRQSGKDFVVEDIEVSSNSRNLKSLLTKGGCADQLREIRVTESNSWKYFPESNKKKKQ